MTNKNRLVRAIMSNITEIQASFIESKMDKYFKGNITLEGISLQLGKKKNKSRIMPPDKIYDYYKKYKHQIHLENEISTDFTVKDWNNMTFKQKELYLPKSKKIEYIKNAPTKICLFNNVDVQDITNGKRGNTIKTDLKMIICKVLKDKGISTKEMSKTLNITQRSACNLIYRHNEKLKEDYYYNKYKATLNFLEYEK